MQHRTHAQQCLLTPYNNVCTLDLYRGKGFPAVGSLQRLASSGLEAWGVRREHVASPHEQQRVPNILQYKTRIDRQHHNSGEAALTFRQSERNVSFTRLLGTMKDGRPYQWETISRYVYGLQILYFWVSHCFVMPRSWLHSQQNRKNVTSILSGDRISFCHVVPDILVLFLLSKRKNVLWTLENRGWCYCCMVL